MAPDLTVPLPVRNGLPHLAEALGSLSAQTYGGGRCLAWDDGSRETLEGQTRWDRRFRAEAREFGRDYLWLF